MAKTALVTGANRGIGARTAQLLSERGLRMILAVRDPAAGEEILASLHGDGHEVLALDVEDPASIRQAIDALSTTSVDVLVNNAGVLRAGDALNADPTDMDLSWRVNVRGPWMLVEGLVPGMVERGYGRVVNVSSGGGSFGEGSMMTGHATYAVTKAALNALTVCTAALVEGDVKINAACPGWVRTRMGGDAAPRSVDEGAGGIVWLATLPADGPHGGFFRDGEAVPW
jgi:NAD(P)-dependent dehydrogenase (short-subunit alcohol dehydrogenase family)